jgi:hypothetical protein
MELTTKYTTGSSYLAGCTELTDLPAGKHLKIETSPAGVEILDAVVPTGKKWTSVKISVEVQEAAE